jgi:hypothetical protein
MPLILPQHLSSVNLESGMHPVVLESGMHPVVPNLYQTRTSRKHSPAGFLFLFCSDGPSAECDGNHVNIQRKHELNERMPHALSVNSLPFSWVSDCTKFPNVVWIFFSKERFVVSFKEKGEGYCALCSRTEAHTT